ncbi:FkbM family methyltransferase [Muricoccus aerilatus]|uniref:FkbM family methyltransferase n=1 Tax=Muricoccus aerilatus TaxID=452982 RepID=UPI0014706A7E|nr:FkbM family methyltransferase [Roseomonas aerilata]
MPHFMIALSQFRHLEQASGWLFDRLGGEYRHQGLRFTVPTELTTRRFRGRFLLGLYEMPERRLLRHLPHDCTLLDLGGCLGVVSCLANRRLQDPRRHVVVEANPALLPTLITNRNRNDAAFTIVNGVVGGDGKFWPGGNIVAGSAHRPRAEPIHVPMVDVASLEMRHSLKFDAFVMDIEGGEAEFIAVQEARLSRARFVLVEFHPSFIGKPACDTARQRLSAAGLVCAGKVLNAEAWIRAKRPAA